MAKYDDDDDDDGVDIRKPRGGGGGEVPNYLVQAVLVTLCCCLPLGIVAIIKASQVNTLLAKGDYDQAVAASEEAKKWCWIAFGLGIIANVVVGAIQIMAGGGGQFK
jgi:Interferon-induced transmembrane protein